jgi:4-hydroxybenzoate polyprenyltransferase
MPQWTKNVFVLAPLLTGQKLFQIDAVWMSAWAVIVFSLSASFIYIVNDILDRQRDCLHPTKKSRPLAAGKVTPISAAALALLCLAAFFLSFVYSGLPSKVALVIALYAALNMAYCFGLKNVPILEFMIVASGYVLRVIAGCFAISVVPSMWLLATTASVALLIVVGKRRGEITDGEQGMDRPSLKLYTPEILDMMMTILTSITIATYMLFTMSDYAVERYQSHYLVATSAFVVFGTFRYLLLVKTSNGHAAPTDFILSDPGILITVVLWALSLTVILYN